MGILWQFYKKYLSMQKDMWFVRLLSFITSIILVVVDSYVVLILGDIIDQVSAGKATLGEKLIEMIIYLSIPFIVEPLTFYIKGFNQVHMQRRIASSVYSSIINQDYKYHINKETGKLITKVLRASDLIHLLVWDLEYHLLSNILQFFIPLIFIYSISPNLSLIAFAVFILTLPLLYFAVRVNVKYRTIARDAEYERNNVIADGISNFTTVRAFGKERREVDLLDEKLQKLRIAEMKYQNTWRFVDFVSRLSGILVFGVVGYITYRQFYQSLISLGDVIIIVTYMMMFLGKVIGLFFSIRNVVKDIPVMSDVLEILGGIPEIQDTQNPKHLATPQGKISLKNIHFTYSRKTQVIEGITLDIEPKQTVAFVGPSGGGKTTLTKLIMRYYEPSQGEILIDGVNVKELSYDDLRKLIGLVPQDPVLFNRSLYYNVAYAFEDDFQDKEKYFEMVVEACKKAQIHNFIEKLPDGYETIVGERGLKLSGGQKQRIAIAQVIIKNPKIVIFDEATSQLDSESEKAIQTAFTEMSRDKTVIIIAHRLSTITHADNIFVIDQGKIKEAGTHKELLSNKNGIYSTLWGIQSGGFAR